MLFPSCALEYWSDDSGIAGFLFGSSEKIYNPHYFETLDFISVEELTWEMDPHHVSAEYRSKSWQKKELRQMKWITRQAIKRQEKKESRALGLLPPHHKPGTNNRWMFWKPQHAVGSFFSISVSSDSIPSEENTISDSFFFSMLL